MLLLLTGALITGAAAGVIAGMLGVGGGVVTVPALLYLFHLDGINPVVAMQLAVGTSLAAIVVTNSVATLGHHRRGGVRWDLAFDFLPGVLFGSLLGSQLAVAIPGGVLRALFGWFEIAVGLKMVLGGETAPGDGVVAIAEWWFHLLSISIGAISALFGIGGGTLLVPTLVLIFKVPMRQGVGTSSATGVVIASSGAVGYIHAGWSSNLVPPEAWGFVLPAALGAIITGTMVTTPLGVRLAHVLDPRLLKRVFGWFLLAVGVKLALM